MKCVILAGGFGTRISEESHLRPKPMIEIGGRPILWHIMKLYARFGVDEFVICLGYKGYMIKEYFANYLLHVSDVTFDLDRGSVEVHERRTEPWRVTLVDTGEHTNTGGRLARVRSFIGDETFFFTYGDGVSDVDIGRLLEFHRSHGQLVTLTAVEPPGRYGAVELDGEGRVESFMEKAVSGKAWINGGFFVLEPGVFRYIPDDTTSWEAESLPRLTADGAVAAFRHAGFWQSMDTLRDRTLLEQLWQSGRAPWRTWPEL